MLNVRATGDPTSLDMVGSPSDLATELARAVQHVCAKLITHVNPEDRQELAGALAAGMTLDEIPYWRDGTLEKYTPSGDYLLLIIGTVLCCAFQEIMAGVVLLVAAIGLIAVLWVRFLADVLADEAEERAEEMAEQRYQELIENTKYHVEYRQFVGLGKGYK